METRNEDLRRLIELVLRKARRSAGQRHFEDVAQDAIIRLMPHIRKGQIELALRFAPQAVRWASLSHLQREARQSACELSDCEDVPIGHDARCEIPQLPAWMLTMGQSCMRIAEAIRAGAHGVGEIAASTGMRRSRIASVLKRIASQVGILSAVGTPAIDLQMGKQLASSSSRSADSVSKHGGKSSHDPDSPSPYVR